MVSVKVNGAILSLELDTRATRSSISHKTYGDILVTGKNEAEHLKNLNEVLSRLEQAGIFLKRKQQVSLIHLAILFQ